MQYEIIDLMPQLACADNEDRSFAILHEATKDKADGESPKGREEQNEE